jgi:hypothetical protein
LRCLDHEDAKGTKSTKREEHEGVRCRAHFLRVFALRVLRGLSCLRDPNTFPPIAAAFAWQQYRQQGRGCIVIDVPQAKDPPPGESHLFGETLGARHEELNAIDEPVPWTAHLCLRPRCGQSRLDGGPGNGQKIWASAWTGMSDVAYNLACLQSVAMGLSKSEVIKVAEKACDEAKHSNKPVWVPNPQGGPAGEYLAAGASGKEVILADRTTLPWLQAAKLTGKLGRTNHKENLLERMRRVSKWGPMALVHRSLRWVRRLQYCSSEYVRAHIARYWV